MGRKVNKTMNEKLPLLFGENFLEFHAGQIMSDSRFAIIELVANCWDASASKVEIVYPEKEGERFSVRDNGVGMTTEEFKFRWGNLNYNRLIHQRSEVIHAGKSKRQRSPFGKNGVGRHAMFCFMDEYFVETIKNGFCTMARVQKSRDGQPFQITIEDIKGKNGQGTYIYGKATKNILLREQNIAELIGSKFVADPEFEIQLNGNKITLTDLDHLIIVKEFDMPGLGKILIRRFEGEKNRTTQYQGVAWWVNRRLVGTPTWEGINGRLIDGRNAIAKKYVYVIEVDFLKPFVKEDWSGFKPSNELNITRQEVYNFLNEDLTTLLYETRRERRDEAFSINKQVLNSLPKIVQEDLSEVIDKLQQECPTFGTPELETTVKVLAIMEKSRSGYALLEKLSNLNPHDVDGLNAVLEEWSVTDIKRVINELHWRLELINELEKLIDNSAADELHDLQPLFERGLWIFGPEFESINFYSNRTLSTIVKNYFGNKVKDSPKKRPDFVVLEDSTIGIYSRDSFNQKHEIDGLESVVIIELKKGGFELDFKEKDQAMGYAREIRKSGKLNKATKIVCYVLGSKINSEVEEYSQEGETIVIPMRYSTVTSKAKARLFNLLARLEKYSIPKESLTDQKKVAQQLFQ